MLREGDWSSVVLLRLTGDPALTSTSASLVQMYSLYFTSTKVPILTAVRPTAAVQSNLQAILADISQRERLATRALQEEHDKSVQATSQVPAGGGAAYAGGGDVTLSGGSEDAMRKDMEVVKAAFDPHLHLHDMGKRMEDVLDPVRRLFPHAQPPSGSAFPAGS
jgi:hypothetical protein